MLYGQVIGDSLGSLVEFKSAAEIVRLYPSGVRELADGGPFNLSAGQPTDDSEMALALARSLVRCGGFDADDVLASYQRWESTGPADIGITVSDALARGHLNPHSEANGAMMRISPLALRYADDLPALSLAVRWQMHSSPMLMSTWASSTKTLPWHWVPPLPKG